MSASRKRVLRGFGGLPYVTVEGIPIRKTKFGDVIDLPPNAIGRAVATALVVEGIPLRGREVHFLRKILGLSMGRFGAKFDLSGTAIMKWEKDPEKRLPPVNEVAVRALVAEELKIKCRGWFSDLRDERETPGKLRVRAA